MVTQWMNILPLDCCRDHECQQVTEFMPVHPSDSICLYHFDDSGFFAALSDLFNFTWIIRLDNWCWEDQLFVAFGWVPLRNPSQSYPIVQVELFHVKLKKFRQAAKNRCRRSITKTIESDAWTGINFVTCWHHDHDSKSKARYSSTCYHDPWWLFIRRPVTWVHRVRSCYRFRLYSSKITPRNFFWFADESWIEITEDLWWGSIDDELVLRVSRHGCRGEDDDQTFRWHDTNYSAKVSISSHPMTSPFGFTNYYRASLVKSHTGTQKHW